MALHAIRAGEGDVFISAGVESVSSFITGNADGLPPNTKNPLFDAAQARSAKLAEGGVAWTDPREEGLIPDVYLGMGQTAENVASATGITREDQDRWAVRSQNRAEEAIARGFFEREITPVTLADGTVVSKDDGPPRAGTTYEASAASSPSSAPRRHRHRRQRLPAQRRRSRTGDHVRHQGKGTRPDPPLARIVSTGVSGLSPPRSWASARSRPSRTP